MSALLKFLAVALLGLVLLGVGAALVSGSVTRPPVVDDGNAPPTDPAPVPDDGYDEPVPVPPPGAVNFDVSSISLIRSGRITLASNAYAWQFYRNRAYQCGVSGHYVFLMLEGVGRSTVASPLWVLLPGGGAGYYDSHYNYHGTESFNVEPNQDRLLAEVEKHVVQNGRAVDTIVHRRLQAGWRLLMPVACDHDLYSGDGGPYPNNPHGSKTVDGQRATMAAVYYGAHVRSTEQVFLHGTSAGSVGAWSLLRGFARNGVKLNGAILDAYTFSTTLDAVQSEPGQCSELYREDNTYSMPELRNKVGALLSGPAQYAERNLGVDPDIPLFAMIGEYDPYCCGDMTPIADTLAAGYSSNCRYAYSAVEQAIAGQNSPLYQFAFVEGRGHVLSFRPEPIQARLESWFQAVMATRPVPPWQ